MYEKDVKITFVLHYREKPRKRGKVKHPEYSAGLVTIPYYFLLPKIRNLKKEDLSNFLYVLNRGANTILKK